MARAIRMGLQGKDPGPFRYRHYGNLAALGRRSAIIEFGWLHLHGFVAWTLWCVAPHASPHFVFMTEMVGGLATVRSGLPDGRV